MFGFCPCHIFFFCCKCQWPVSTSFTSYRADTHSWYRYSLIKTISPKSSLNPPSFRKKAVCAFSSLLSSLSSRPPIDLLPFPSSSKKAIGSRLVTTGAEEWPLSSPPPNVCCPPLTNKPRRMAHMLQRLSLRAHAKFFKSVKSTKIRKKPVNQ